MPDTFATSDPAEKGLRAVAPRGTAAYGRTMDPLLLQNDAVLVLAAAVGLVATLLAIMRDTRIRRRSLAFGAR